MLIALVETQESVGWGSMVSGGSRLGADLEIKPLDHLLIAQSRQRGLLEATGGTWHIADASWHQVYGQFVRTRDIPDHKPERSGESQDWYA